MGRRRREEWHVRGLVTGRTLQYIPIGENHECFNGESELGQKTYDRIMILILLMLFFFKGGASFFNFPRYVALKALLKGQ